MAKKDELDLGSGPGIGTVSIPEVDDAAATYVKFRDRRMELTTIIMLLPTDEKLTVKAIPEPEPEE